MTDQVELLDSFRGLGLAAGTHGTPVLEPELRQLEVYRREVDPAQLLDAWRQGYRLGRADRLDVMRRRMVQGLDSSTALSQTRIALRHEVEAAAMLVRVRAEVWSSRLVRRGRTIVEQSVVRDVLLGVAASLAKGEHRRAPDGDRLGMVAFLRLRAGEWHQLGNGRLSSELFSLAKGIQHSAHLARKWKRTRR